MYAIQKYEKIIENERDNERLFQLMRTELANPKAINDKPLKKSEVVEILKYLDRTDLINEIENLQVPKFGLNLSHILKHKIFVAEQNSYLTLEDYSNHHKIRFNYLLNNLNSKWIESNLTLTNEQLLNMIDQQFLWQFLNVNVKTKKK